eukprot:tig00000704_g3316.t1
MPAFLKFGRNKKEYDPTAPEPPKRFGPLEELIRRVEKVMDETGEGKKKKKKDDGDPSDEFTQVRTSIGNAIKEIRKMIQERDAMNPKKAGQKEVVAASAKIRGKIREVKDEYTHLKQILQSQQRQFAINSKKKKPGKSNITEDKLSVREDMIKLIGDHIQQVEDLEKRRFGTDKNDKNKKKLLEGARAGTSGKTTFGRSAITEDLPDVNDPEIEEGLERLYHKNAEIDKDLDDLSKGVSRLDEIARTQNSQLKQQAAMIEELNKKGEQTLQHAQNVNKKMKDLIKQIKPHNFCVDITLFIILIGCAGLIYTLVK